MAGIFSCGRMAKMGFDRKKRRQTGEILWPVARGLQHSICSIGTQDGTDEIGMIGI